MKTPHKHADIIKAWADGAEIEFFASHSNEWKPIGANPQWFESLSFRIKPEPKPDVVEHMSIYRNLNRRYESERPVGERIDIGYVGNVQLTWDGETGKLKSAEVL